MKNNHNPAFCLTYRNHIISTPAIYFFQSYYLFIL